VTAVILGCGYTGKRVAALLAARGIEVIATSRHVAGIAPPCVRCIELDVTRDLDLSFIPVGARVIYSIPIPEPDVTPLVLAALEGRAARIVYLSTASVYGQTMDVDETTRVDPQDAAARARVGAEQTIQAGPWTALILRPAAIYGPGRGVHARLQRGDFSLAGDGTNYVSRIHVDDLATHALEALLSTVTGAFPVADAHPCTSREITEFCADLLHLPLPAPVDPSVLHPTRRANRRVDGSAIRRILGVELRYSSYRTGIPACIGLE
jgi:nucleoside-diphosphate-sugar epimerase